jgi:dihydrofolate synthase/folylpolyglutamate synthase
MSSAFPWTYEQALAFWYRRVNFEQRPPLASDLKLDRMRGLLARLGNPHERLRIVHVAGSKGKGSTSAMLAAILRAAGYRAGMFTSPHLTHVEERIQVDGRPISHAELMALLAEVRAVTGDAVAGPAIPTFFEVATAVGFLHFVRRRVDIAVMEVGLGGRFDSTNVCDPLVSLITSISLDHTQQLGNSLSSIAKEKAGIVKPGRPTISGATDASARAVIEQVCAEHGAPLRQLGIDFHYRYEAGEVSGHGGIRAPRVGVSTDKQSWPVMNLGLLGEHQAANAAVALACVDELRTAGWHLPDEAVAHGLAEVHWPARMEAVGRQPLVILDCAHNVASAHALVETLRQSFHGWPPERRLLLFAGSGDKDLDGMMDVLAPQFRHAFLTRYNGARSVPPAQLASLLAVRGAAYSLHANATDAWLAATELAGPEDLICVTGSVFLAGELRPVLSKPAAAGGDA